MVLNPQTHPFPGFQQIEQSWEQNLRAVMDLLNRGPGIRSGLKLGIPLSSSQPTTGLTPTLTDGYITDGDQVLGPFGSDLISAAPASATRGLYFGLSGMYYGTAPLSDKDVLIGTVVTGANRILSVAQAYNYGAGRWGVRGAIDLANATDGADTTFFTWVPPADLGLDNLRVSYAQARIVSVVTTGNTAGDDFVLKVKNGSDSAVSLVTIDDADLVTAGHTQRSVPVSATVHTFNGSTGLAFQYNQTDTSTAIAGGMVEVSVILEAFA